MPVPQIIHPVLHAALDAPDLGFHHTVRTFAGFALHDGVHEIAMHRGHVIAVGHVIGLHFPVMVAHIGLRAFDHFEPVGGLVGEQVDEELCLAQVVVQRRDLIGQGAKNKAAIFIDAGNFGQVVLCAVELCTVAAFFVLDTDTFAGTFIAPPVEATRDGLRIALFERGDDGAAMGARIDERLDRAVLLAMDEDRLAADMRCIVIAGVRHLAFMAQKVPQLLEAEFHLGIVDIFILEDRAVQPEFVIRFRPVVDAVGQVDAGSFISHGRAPEMPSGQV